jgi:hypothetical protein
MIMALKLAVTGAKLKNQRAGHRTEGGVACRKCIIGCVDRGLVSNPY